MSTSSDSVNGSCSTDRKEYRWVVEFLAGPGGYLEKAEVVSEWFPSLEDAKDDAWIKAKREVESYPFSHGKILKLLVEDKEGSIIELQNAKNIPLRWTCDVLSCWQDLEVVLACFFINKYVTV